MSSEGRDVARWLTTPQSGRQFSPHTLSVTASRLLVTSYAPNELMLFDRDGVEIRRVSLPEGKAPYHGVESPTGAFVVVHSDTQLKQWQVSEVTTDGRVLRQFSESLSWPDHIAVDSLGNVFVADTGNRQILLLDAQLVVCHVIIDEHLLNKQEPRRLCYLKHSGQLLVGSGNSVATFDLLQVSQVSQLITHGIFQKNYLQIWFRLLDIFAIPLYHLRLHRQHMMQPIAADKVTFQGFSECLLGTTTSLAETTCPVEMLLSVVYFTVIGTGMGWVQKLLS